MLKLICTKCLLKKDINDFEFRKDSNNYRKQCKICRSKKIKSWHMENKEEIFERYKEYNKEYNKKYKIKNNKKLKVYTKQYYIDNKEKLDMYKKEWNKKNKPNDFRKDYFKQYQKDNRVDINKYKKEWNKKNLDKLKKYKETYIKNNPEYVNKIKIWRRKYNNQYNKDNKEKIMNTKSIYEKNRRKIDINYKIKCNLRTRIYSVLIGKSKSSSTIELLGCTIVELKNHLSKYFTSEMSWSNYGSYWEIDHVFPCAIFDLTNPIEQKKCFNYKNLQPLESNENRSKQHNIKFRDIVF